MTRLSEYLLPTEREAPADAEAVSHKLMVRAGLVRQVGAGLWSWLPAGWRVHQRIVRIVREEIDAIGGQEMLMPVLQPIEPWRRTGRDGIDELFKLEDRKGAKLVLAMTHEEVVTWHIAQLVRSYRDLPMILYHFQVKARDEQRPRAGILRTREFVMKDSYTFDRDAEGLAAGYEKHVGAYARILDRCGLEWYRVEADVGMMGGLGGHEYMAPCPAGEDEVALAPGYAANVEIATAQARTIALDAAPEAAEDVHTPGLTTVEQVSGALEVPAGGLLKAFPVMVDGRSLVLAVLRGDHRVNEIKLRNALGAPFRPAREEEVQALGPGGFLGPVGLGEVPVLLDAAVVGDDGQAGYVTGANRPDTHLRGVRPGRDFAFDAADIRRVEPGDHAPGGGEIRFERAIEVGHIFKLGTRYSEPLDATYLDESGEERLVWMGSYGIGPARIAAAAVEQYADERGICWPRTLAPFDVEIVVLGKPGTPERDLAEHVYSELSQTGLEVLYDDRAAGPGEKFADAELLGCPLRVTVGSRTRESGELEVQVRRGLEARSVGLKGGAEAVSQLWRTLP